MRKRLAVITTLAVGFSSLVAAPASAAGCGLAGLMPCPSQPSSPPPSSQPSSPPPSQPSSPPPSQPAPRGEVGEAPGAAARILQLVNGERAGAGLAPLQHRGDVAGIAAGHSRAMADRRDIWHNDAYFTASTRRALGARGLGENVALNGSIDDAHRRLMASPGHRANILNGSFDTVGMAVVRDADGVLYVTQNFVDSASPSAAPAKKAKGKSVAKARKGKAVAKGGKGKARKAVARKGRKSAVGKAGARKSRSSLARTRQR